MILALAVFAVPPLLANAYTGLRLVDAETRTRQSGWACPAAQLLRRVELPLAVPYLAAGLRTAAVQVVATATLATLVNGGGLGTIISAGFGLGISRGGAQIVAGGIAVVLLALLAEALFAGVERLVTPRPLRSVRRRRAARRRHHRVTDQQLSGKLSYPPGRPRHGIQTGNRTSAARRDTRRGHGGRAGTQKAAVCVDTCS